MNCKRLIVQKILFSLTFFFTITFVGNKLYAQDGKVLFQSNCAQCHNPLKVVIGPALQGVDGRVPDKKLLHDWIHNYAKVLASGNKYFNDLYSQFKTPMNLFPGLTDPEIDAIIKYVDDYKAPGAPAPGGAASGRARTPPAG